MITNITLAELVPTTLADIASEADQVHACGNYSQTHPTTTLNDNPYFPDTVRWTKRAWGTRNVTWMCGRCGLVTPGLNGTNTACCGYGAITIDASPRDTRRALMHVWGIVEFTVTSMDVYIEGYSSLAPDGTGWFCMELQDRTEAESMLRDLGFSLNAINAAYARDND